MKFERIKELRKEQGLTQKYISEILNISRQLYSRYETGTQRIPVKHLITLSKYYDTSIDYILDLSDERKPNDSNSKQ